MSPAPSLQELIHLVETETEDSSPLGRLRAASGLAGHLAEVGDAALGYFVDQARHAGHSWSQIGDALGVSKQAAQQKHTVRHASSLEEPGFERFTPRARNAVSDAELVAREWGHDYVGTEHLLLSLYRDPNGLAAHVLIEMGITEDQATDAIAQRVERGGGAREGTLPFTRKATAAVDAGRSAAVDLGHSHVGTEHLLIGLDRVDGVAKEVLEHAGLTPEQVSQQVIAKLAPYDQRGARSTDRTARDEEKGVE
jgi:antitoxin component of RelBE/YafQ-DinJ toxin-antitoxin module